MPTLSLDLRLQSLAALLRRLRFQWRARSRASRAAREAWLSRPIAVREGPFVGWFDSSQDLQSGLAITEHGDDLVLL